MSEISAVTTGSNFEGYIESWAGEFDTVELLDAMPIDSKTVIDIAFCSFDLVKEDPLNGLEFSEVPFLNESTLNTVVSKVHDKGGFVKLSFGGPLYLISDALTEKGPISLAADIANIIKSYNLKGVDLNIEDTNLDSENMIKFLESLRIDLGIAHVITLTVPGQNWSMQPWLTEGLDFIDAITFMEYDIWVPSDSSYVSQIKEDTAVYINEWNIPRDKIQLGLMPGQDNNGHVLSIEDAEDLAEFVLNERLFGVSIWDFNRDFQEGTGEGAFTYTYSLEKILRKAEVPN